MSETTKSYCNSCVGMRNHEVLHREEKSWEEEIDDGNCIGGTNKYEILKCLGCEHISVRHEYTFSDDLGPDGLPIIRTGYYPPAIFREKPRWYSEAHWAFGFGDALVPKLLDQIYVALQNDSRSLATMGIRALIEHVMIEKVGDLGGFGKNLSRFFEEGYISKVQREALQPLIEAGHAAMHRGWNPSKNDLVMLMDIIESLIESIYINEYRAKTIKGCVPERPKKSLTNGSS